MPKHLHHDVQHDQIWSLSLGDLQGIAAVGGGDAAQLGVGDADRAADQDAALEAAGVELFLVLVLLLVAVVEAGDGGVAPVDDREAVAVVEEGALADQDVAQAAGPGLAQAQVAEVGVLRVGRGVAALAAGAAEGGDLMHLLDEGGLVLLLGLGEGVAQLEQLGVEVLELLGCGLGLTREPGQNPLKDVGLLGDDALAVGREGCEFLVGLLDRKSTRLNSSH